MLVKSSGYGVPGNDTTADDQTGFEFQPAFG
jgi:hypothetical protein